MTYNFRFQFNTRVLLLSILSVVLGTVATVIAQILIALIGLTTNVAYYGQFSPAPTSPAGNRLGIVAIGVPMVGGLLVGIMARYGSRSIRGHGIPEAIEQVLSNESRIAPRVMVLKPLSSAIAIGTGGPFGAEGPIIATGGAFGSVLGQMVHLTASERKTLLAAGAAAGMTAIFGSPLAAILLAVELLLFEFSSRTLIPIALACVAADGVRLATSGMAPVFAMPNITAPIPSALIFYVLLGAAAGLVSVIVTGAVYAVEDGFERLPIHWMWWPAIGGAVVGVVGIFAPRTLGVGYGNISDMLAGHLLGRAVFMLCLLKFVSWAFALGSGTSGGTLAPLFTIGGGFGAAVAGFFASHYPGLGLDPKIGALVGMAAVFAGASRALLTSIVFALETTLQPMGLLPLIGGCTAAYLVSLLLMRNTIMTEKIERRGVRVPHTFTADYLEQVLVKEVGVKPVVSLPGGQTLAETRLWMLQHTPETHHQGFPVVDPEGRVIGVVTRRDLLDPAQSGDSKVLSLVRRSPIVVTVDQSLRTAADLMVHEEIGRLVVVKQEDPTRPVGMLTRGDLLSARAPRLRELHVRRQHIDPFERLRRYRRSPLAAFAVGEKGEETKG